MENNFPEHLRFCNEVCLECVISLIYKILFPICKDPHPVGIYLHKVNNRSTRKRCEIYSKLTIKTPERYQWRHSGIFIVNFEHILHLVLVFLLLTLNMLEDARK